MAPTAKIIVILISVAIIVAFSSAHFFPSNTTIGESCGPTCIYAIGRQLGVITKRSITPQTLRQYGTFAISDFSELARSAMAIGLNPAGMKMSVVDLRRRKPIGILHIDGRHFVAVIGYVGRRVEVADPIGLYRWRNELWGYSYLSAHWDGRILIITKR